MLLQLFWKGFHSTCSYTVRQWPPSTLNSCALAFIVGLSWKNWIPLPLFSFPQSKYIEIFGPPGTKMFEIYGPTLKYFIPHTKILLRTSFTCTYKGGSKYFSWNNWSPCLYCPFILLQKYLAPYYRSPECLPRNDAWNNYGPKRESRYFSWK